MTQGKKGKIFVDERSPLLDFFSAPEPLPKQRELKVKADTKQSEIEDTLRPFLEERVIPHKKAQAGKAVFVTRTEEISFEEFLKSRPKGD